MQQTNPEPKVSQPSQTSAENEKESNKNSSPEILSIEELDKPIDIIQSTNGWFLAMGRTRLSVDYKTKDEAIDFTTKWEFAINLMITIHEQCTQLQNLDQNKYKQNGL